MRCLAFAEEWKKSSKNIFFISNCKDNNIVKKITQNGFNFILVKDSYPNPDDIKVTLSIINKNDLGGSSWVLIDGYNFDVTYQNEIKKNGNKLIFIDDIAHLSNYSADIIVNQNISAEKLNYNCSEKTELLLGSRYTIIRDDFLKFGRTDKRKFSKPRNLLITLGGSNPFNFSSKLVKFINLYKTSKLNIKVVVGSLAKHNKMDLDSFYHEIDFVQIKPNDMPRLMAWADIAISSGGSTPWELAFMGLPGLVICFAENQIHSMNRLHKYGSIINLGWYEDLTNKRLLSDMEKLLNNKLSRINMSMKGMKLIDGNGRKRIIDTMKYFHS